jgi:hypothetical protein
MLCRASLQTNGNLNLPADLNVDDAAALSVRFQRADLDVAVVATLSRWHQRCWMMFPGEARRLCQPPCQLDVDVTTLKDLVATDTRALVPCNGIVRFKARIREHGGLLVSVPLVWYRGMQRAGWSHEVAVQVTSTKDTIRFKRMLSVRAGGKTVVLALPRSTCSMLEANQEVEVELRPHKAAGAPDLMQLKHFPINEWCTWTKDRQEAELAILVETYRAAGFPWDVVRSRTERAPLDGVRRSRISVVGDLISSVGYAGQRTCLAIHAHRLNARCGKSPSVVEAFENDRLLRHALRFQLDRGNPVVPHRLLRALSALTHSPLNFPPTLARWLVDLYAPENGIVFDPCSGYGGRLLGSLASVKSVTYVGADIEPASVSANIRLAAFLGAAHRVIQEERAIETSCAWPKADLALVGPPYYNRENYGEASYKALTNYPTYDVWIEQFVSLLVVRTLEAAPVAVFNVAAIRDKTVIRDLPADLIRTAQQLGIKIERILEWKTARFNSARTEKLIVLTR